MERVNFMRIIIGLGFAISILLVVVALLFWVAASRVECNLNFVIWGCGIEFMPVIILLPTGYVGLFISTLLYLINKGKKSAIPTTIIIFFLVAFISYILLVVFTTNRGGQTYSDPDHSEFEWFKWSRLGI